MDWNRGKKKKKKRKKRDRWNRKEMWEWRVRRDLVERSSADFRVAATRWKGKKVD